MARPREARLLELIVTMLVLLANEIDQTRPGGRGGVFVHWAPTEAPL